MPRALPTEIRLDIVRRHLAGQALPQIATELRLSHDTVRALWRAFRNHGEDGLATRYHACGRATPATPEVILDAACRFKHDHPTWGAGRIRLQLLQDLAAGQVPSVRVLQRAFQRAGVNRPRRSQRPPTAVVRAPAPHEVWQVDRSRRSGWRPGRRSVG
jgi:Helix-turn-helix domain